MTAESETDRAAFLDADDFGQSVTIQPDGQAPREIEALFLNRSENLLESSAQVPTLIARASDVSDLADDDPVTIDGVTYKVRLPEPDGTGMTAIQLEKSP